MADTDRLTPSKIAFWCFALTVALLPIGLGGNRPIPLGLAQAGLALSVFFLLRDNQIWQEIVFFPRLRWALGLFGLVVVWTLLQIQPLVPAAWMHPLWQETAATLHRPLHGAIAISPEDTLNGLSRFLSAMGCGFIAYVVAQEPKRAKKLLHILWYAAAGISVYGLLAYLAGNGTILWFEKWAYPNDLSATFVNRNHFAIYAGMGFVVGAALLMQSWREEIQKKKHREPQKAIAAWVVKNGVPQVFLLTLVLIAIVMSHSRAGLTLTLFGLGLYLFLHQIYVKAWRRAAVVAIFAVLVVILTVIAAGIYSEHFATLFSDYSSRDRFTVYGMMGKALAANPLLGYGFGGFQPIFRLYQHGMIMEFNHGHSDVLESLFDLGLPVGLALWAAIILLLTGLMHGILRRRRYGLFATLALAVSLMLLAHALVDFSLQIPGVVFYWAAILGTGLAQSWRESEKEALLDQRVVKIKVPSAA